MRNAPSCLCAGVSHLSKQEGKHRQEEVRKVSFRAQKCHSLNFYWLKHTETWRWSRSSQSERFSPLLSLPLYVVMKLCVFLICIVPKKLLNNYKTICPTSHVRMIAFCLKYIKNNKWFVSCQVCVDLIFFALYVTLFKCGLFLISYDCTGVSTFQLRLTLPFG